ncbi:hypothetical protein LCGC14_2334240 [marine sediment metagenome]|uniref:Uncharacterized protein n=1 Tax=marine sediment metagenome TaxID=412755 RepID=A0A0F9D1E6_9ZZZZ
MIKSDNYTYINPNTLEAEFPQEEDNVLRPVEQLRERTPEEMAKLRNHPFFK